MVALLVPPCSVCNWPSSEGERFSLAALLPEAPSFTFSPHSRTKQKSWSGLLHADVFINRHFLQKTPFLPQNKLPHNLELDSILGAQEMKQISIFMALVAVYNLRDAAELVIDHAGSICELVYNVE